MLSIECLRRRVKAGKRISPASMEIVATQWLRLDTLWSAVREGYDKPIDTSSYFILFFLSIYYCLLTRNKYRQAHKFVS